MASPEVEGRETLRLKPVKRQVLDLKWIPDIVGKIIVISWGSSKNPPILLLHGFMDTAATFSILVDQLPDKYYYVAFDMPGHGKSDPLPSGLHVYELHMVEATRIIVEHMKWQQFTYIAHSMGCVIGLFYNHLYPNNIKKMIFFDPGPPLSRYYFSHHKLPVHYSQNVAKYYDNYQELNLGKPKLQSYEKAVSTVVKNRQLTEEQAEILLSRSLIPMGIDTYRLSFEPRMKKLSQLPLSKETLYTIMTSLPATLSVEASYSRLESTYTIEFADNLLHKCVQTSPVFYRTTIIGGHDFHITCAKELSQSIMNFIECSDVDIRKIFGKSKL